MVDPATRSIGFFSPRQDLHAAAWGSRFGDRGHGSALTVRELVVPAPVRLAQAVAGAAIVRDAAAFAALVVLFTMFAVLSGFEPLV
jgi:hypothetical protein